MDNTPLAVTDTAPSGDATGALEEEKRDTPTKEKEDKVKETEPIVDSPTKLLVIDTFEVEKKSIIEMSPT